MPWVKPPDLDSETPIVDTFERLSKKGSEFARILSKDSVMISCIGLLGKIGIAGRELTTNQQINSLTVITHTWRLGDRLFKLAHKHYGDSRYWWIIAWYNLSPTDSHFSIGDTVQIPKPLPKILRYLRIE